MGETEETTQRDGLNEMIQQSKASHLDMISRRLAQAALSFNDVKDFLPDEVQHAFVATSHVSKRSQVIGSPSTKISSWLILTDGVPNNNLSIH